MEKIKKEDAAYPIPENPTYNSKIRKLQNTDYASADELFNPLIQNIIDNIHAVKLSDDTKAKEDLSNVLDSVFLEKVRAVGGSESGLDADTVDGKHASEFAPSGFGLGTNCISIPNESDLNDLPKPYRHASGFFTGGTLQNKPPELAGWIYLFQLSGSESFKLQVAFSVNGNALVMGDIFIRQYINGIWNEWKKPDASSIGGKDLTYLLNYDNLTNKPEIPTALPANGGNADMVGGKNAADLQNYNNLTNKPNFKPVATTGNYNDLINKPETLPANGGNADTVDSKHASDFAPSGFGFGETCVVLPEGADLNNLPEKYKNKNGFFTGGSLQNKPPELAGWIYLINMSGSNDYKAQIALSANGWDSVMGDIFIRQYKGGTWREWKKPDASTVGGKSADVLYSNCSKTAPTAYLGDNVQYQVY